MACYARRRKPIRYCPNSEPTLPSNPDRDFWVYLTANAPRGVLYVGMTSDLSGRAFEHRNRMLDGFTKRYNVGRFVYFEIHHDSAVAASRERLMKRWRRDWKIALVEENNPTWRDLFPDVLAAEGFDW